MDKLSIVLKEVDDKVKVVAVGDDKDKKLLDLDVDEIVLNGTVLKAPMSDVTAYPVVRWRRRDECESKYQDYLFKVAPSAYSAIFAFKYANENKAKNLSLFYTSAFIIQFTPVILKDDPNTAYNLRKLVPEFDFVDALPNEFTERMLNVASNYVDNLEAFEFEMLADIFELISKPSLLEYNDLIDIFGLYLLNPISEKYAKKCVNGKKIDTKTIGMIYHLIKTINRYKGIFPDKKLDYMVGKLSIPLMVYDAQAIPFNEPVK